MNPHGGGPASPQSSTPKACPSCGARYPADALFCSLDGSPLTTSPGAIAAAAANDYYVGREILGHIEIRQLVGLGAMGRVYRAFQTGIDRDVAVKILHRELSSNPAVVARFTREAKVAARLSHPNVVHVLLVGQLPDGAMYIVMEFLDGMSLQSALAAAGGAMPLPRALHVALQLCEAAGAAHEGGIVHRDLKPENIMLIERAGDPDFVKVLDFGIARLSWADPSMATAAGLVFGTARYISPEGAAGEKVGPQGDVYSIATMVYQMCAGRTPFAGDQAVSLLVQQIHDPPPALKGIARAAHVPDAIADTIMRNLSKRPADRAEDARALGRSLLEAAMESGLSAQDILARPSLLPGGRHGKPLLSARPGGTEIATPTPSPTPTGPKGDGFGSSGPAANGRTEASTERVEPTTAPPGVATAKWVPPPAVRASLTAAVPPPPRVAPTQASEPAIAPSVPASPSSRPSSTVDPTLADEPAPRSSMTTAPPATRPVPSRSRTPVILAAAVLAGLAALVFALRRGPPAPVPVAATYAGAAAERIELPPAASSSESPPAAAAAPPAPPIAPLEGIAPLQGVGASQPAGTPAPGSGSGAVRVTVDTSSARPGVGQPVDLAAHVAAGTSGRPRVDGPRFRISGPGIPPGTELTALDDGSGAYRTTFTFLQPGRFDVTFSARADGAVVRGGRALVVQDPNAPAPAAPAPQQASSAVPPAALPQAKWM